MDLEKYIAFGSTMDRFSSNDNGSVYGLLSGQEPHSQNSFLDGVKTKYSYPDHEDNSDEDIQMFTHYFEKVFNEPEGPIFSFLSHIRHQLRTFNQTSFETSIIQLHADHTKHERCRLTLFSSP